MQRIIDTAYKRKRLTPVYGYLSQPLLPLYQALQPIMPRIECLDQYIKIAKKGCHFPSEHGLDIEESAAIFIYTMEWGEASLYKLLNAELREDDRSKLVPWHGYLKLFTVALGKLPTCKRNLWRGINSRVVNEYKNNETLTWWHINSCTTKIDAVEQFLGREATLFLIEATSGRDISIYSNYPREQEMILPLGTTLRVHAQPLTHAAMHIVHLVEQGDEIETPSMRREGDCQNYYKTGKNSSDSISATPSSETRQLREQSTVKYSDGDHYEGQLKGGLKHEKGTYFFANGDRYEQLCSNEWSIEG